MGTSTNGILFYGFPIDDDSELAEALADREEDEDGDDQEFVARLYGWDGKNPKYASEWEKQNPSPVTIGMHCSDGSPMYYVAIAKAEHTARRGYPEKIESTEVQPEWDGVLRDFLQRLVDRLGMPVPDDVELGWHLASWWG